MRKKRVAPSKLELIARLHRGLRPKLAPDQLSDLALCHINNLDTIAKGHGTEALLWDWVGTVLTWTKVAQMLERGVPEMCEQLELSERLITRYGQTGRIAFTGPDYQLAKVGLSVMDQLALETDRPTAVVAADWSEAQLLIMKTGIDSIKQAQWPAEQLKQAA